MSIDGEENIDYTTTNQENEMSSDTGGLDEQLQELLRDSYNDNTELATATSRLQKLDKKLNQYLREFLPNGIVPVFVSGSQQSTNLSSDYEDATWAEYSSQGNYSGIDDNYCRRMEAGNWMYPRRAPDGDVELANCGKIMNEEVNLIADISSRLPVLKTRAKIKFIKSELGENDPVNSAQTRIFNLINDYNAIHRQYLQLRRNIDINADILHRRNRVLDKSETDLENKNNELEIDKVTFNDWVAVKDNERNKNQNLIKWSKFVLWIFWIIMLGLILLSKTGFVLI